MWNVRPAKRHPAGAAETEVYLARRVVVDVLQRCEYWLGLRMHDAHISLLCAHRNALRMYLSSPVPIAPTNPTPPPVAPQAQPADRSSTTARSTERQPAPHPFPSAIDIALNRSGQQSDLASRGRSRRAADAVRAFKEREA
ncbi:hypothetical protein QFC20_005354 [Naganishia adeliensis]|uniref:Uncharacterized protein n=1 Tax=Naganishia adeliensis TaxID=92952 RepID=A0ACC2VP64_9TREE|nr:hypothetical protein QFC20_005354 [Naganishia adeliensis]